MDKETKITGITLDGEDFYNIPKPLTNDELNNIEKN